MACFTPKRSTVLCSSLLVLLTGCVTRPGPVAKTPSEPPAAAVTAHPASVGTATIKGSEESSLLLDNFTAFIAALDGAAVPAGRTGWATPLKIPAAHHVLAVEFQRGVFSAQVNLTLEAADDAIYELKFATDAEVFGHNSYCDFWIVDTRTGQRVTSVARATVKKN